MMTFLIFNVLSICYASVAESQDPWSVFSTRERAHQMRDRREAFLNQCRITPLDPLNEQEINRIWMAAFPPDSVTITTETIRWANTWNSQIQENAEIIIFVPQSSNIVGTVTLMRGGPRFYFANPKNLSQLIDSYCRFREEGYHPYRDLGFLRSIFGEGNDIGGNIGRIFQFLPWISILTSAGYRVCLAEYSSSSVHNSQYRPEKQKHTNLNHQNPKFLSFLNIADRAADPQIYEILRYITIKFKELHAIMAHSLSPSVLSAIFKRHPGLTQRFAHIILICPIPNMPMFSYEDLTYFEPSFSLSDLRLYHSSLTDADDVLVALKKKRAELLDRLESLKAEDRCTTDNTAKVNSLIDYLSALIHYNEGLDLMRNCLIVYGEDDEITPPQHWYRKNPLLIIKNTGHRPFDPLAQDTAFVAFEEFSRTVLQFIQTRFLNPTHLTKGVRWNSKL